MSIVCSSIVAPSHVRTARMIAKIIPLPPLEPRLCVPHLFWKSPKPGQSQAFQVPSVAGLQRSRVHDVAIPRAHTGPGASLRAPLARMSPSVSSSAAAPSCDGHAGAGRPARPPSEGPGREAKVPAPGAMALAVCLRSSFGPGRPLCGAAFSFPLGACFCVTWRHAIARAGW